MRPDAPPTLTISLDDTAARRLYAELGLVETGEFDGDELVARLELVRG